MQKADLGEHVCSLRATLFLNAAPAAVLSACVCLCWFSVERDLLEEEAGELAVNDDEPCPEPMMLSVSHSASAAF